MSSQWRVHTHRRNRTARMGCQQKLPNRISQTSRYQPRGQQRIGKVNIFLFPHKSQLMFNRMSLADAQTLAIRRLLSKSAYDSNITPGPPLPKSHPPPALLAKLHIECSSLYSSARLLAKTPGASKNLSGDSNMEVCTDLRRYLGNQTALHSALSRKWLGVEAGEKGGMEKGGEAVAFLQWAKKELEELKDGGKLINIGNVDKEQEERWKNAVADELSAVNVFYKYYKKMNDTV